MGRNKIENLEATLEEFNKSLCKNPSSNKGDYIINIDYNKEISNWTIKLENSKTHEEFQEAWDYIQMYTNYKSIGRLK